MAIAKRELASYFYSPIAYVVIALFLMLSGMLFVDLALRPGEEATMRWFFNVIAQWLLGFVVPAISMRLLSDELRSGTMESLMTAPVTDVGVIVGKWAGAMGFFALLLAPTFFYVAVLATWSDPDYGPIFTGYLGLALVGGLYLSIGTFASVLTRNQIIAFLVTVFVIFLFSVIAGFVAGRVPIRFAPTLIYIDVNTHFDAFSKGLIDLRDVVYFVSGIALFLTLGVKALESRKWR